MKLKQGLSIFLAVCLVVVLSAQTPTIEAKTIANDVKDNTTFDNGAIFKLPNVEHLPKPKLTDAKSKKARVDSLVQETHRLWAEGKNQSEINDFLRKNGCIILNVEKDGVYGNTSSIQDDVTMSTPGVAYETWAGYYIITGTMSWELSGSNPKWLSDFSGGAGDAEIVSLSVGDGKNSGLRNRGYYLSIKNNAGVSVHVPNAESWDNSSVIWTPQDQFTSATDGTNKKYNIDSYLATLSVEIVGTTGTGLPVFSNYAHTWKTTAINGFSISTTGLSLSYANSAYGWRAAASPKYFN